jgi:hypothetical protein
VLVINTADVTDGPAPAALTATAVAVYWVPGASPVRFTVVVDELKVLLDPPTTGVTVTV